MFEALGFTKDPFGKELDPGEAFLSAGFGELLARLRHMVEHRSLGLVTGEVGSGKSTAVRVLASELDPTRHPFIYLADSALTPREFYTAVLENLGVTPATSRSAVRRQFETTVADFYEAQNKSPVLVLDEAHELSQPMIREIRYITNVRMDALSPFTLVIVGQPELRGILKLKAFEAVAQRVEIRYHLAGMDLAETKAYLEHGARVAGVDRPLFAEGAITMLHNQSRGLPRLLGNLARAALLDAIIRRQELVEEANVRRAVAEVQEV